MAVAVGTAERALAEKRRGSGRPGRTSASRGPRGHDYTRSVETISFASDEPDASLLPLAELADCAATALRRDGKAILSYGSGGGYTPLRELIGAWFNVHPFRVVLTNGWLQALSLLAADVAVRRPAAIEDPADDRVARTLLGTASSLLYIAGDGDGMLTNDLEQQLIQYARPALIYVNPSFSNPTGRVMSLDRRRHLVSLLHEHNRLGSETMHVLEDHSYALTRFEGERLPTLFDVSSGQTLLGSSFSPTIAPGLRTGFLVLPDDLARKAIDRAGSTYISPALLGQATVFEFIRRGSFEPHLMTLRGRLRERRDVMLAALAEHVPDADWSRPDGGYFVWLDLPDRLDGRAVLARAEGVTALAGTGFGTTSNFVRLSYSATPSSVIAEGIERLARAVAAERDAQQAAADR